MKYFKASCGVTLVHYPSSYTMTKLILHNMLTEYKANTAIYNIRDTKKKNSQLNTTVQVEARHKIKTRNIDGQLDQEKMLHAKLKIIYRAIRRFSRAVLNHVTTIIRYGNEFS